MKIGVDARPLQHETQYRGIGKALESLLTALAQIPLENDRLVFYVDEALPRPAALSLFPDSRTITVPTARLGRKRYIRSVLPPFPLIHPDKNDIDVLLQYDAALGVPASVPAVVAFHDLIPFLFRNQEKRQTASGLRKYKNSLAGSLYWRKYLRTLKRYSRANHIISISNSSKQDFMKFIGGIPEDNIHVIPLAGRDVPPAGKPSKDLKSITDSPYLLYVGGIDFRKNIVALLKAFYALKPRFPDLKLLTVGKEFGLEDQLQDLGWARLLSSEPRYAKDVIMPGFISDEELTYVYQHAAAFVFPSRYEGFGLPVLEAMQAGCPVVAYKNSSIPEVAGDAALLLEDGEPLAPAIERLLNDQNLHDSLVKKGKSQAKKFTWERTARETLAVLRSAAR